MLINTKGSILESLLLLRGLEFGNETFHFDCGINLSRCSIERAGCYGELWLHPLPQDLFSARAEEVLFDAMPSGIGAVTKEKSNLYPRQISSDPVLTIITGNVGRENRELGPF